MAKRSLSALIVATLIAGTAAAADAPKAPAGYVLTGETKHCLQTRRIDSLRIINESQILVEMSNGEAYLQQGNVDAAREQLAEIEKRCGRDCREYALLSGQIDAYVKG